MEHLLADWLEKNDQKLVERWTEVLQETIVPESVRREDVLDSMLEFVRELTKGMRQGKSTEPGTLKPGASAMAKGHGRQRFHLGYDLATVVREYGSLRDLIFEMVEKDGIRPSFQELRVLSKYLIGGIADSATQYGLERDEQARQQTAHHIGFLAHELRNPLASVLLAYATMQRRGELPKSRLADVADRGLKQLSSLIDGALVDARFRASTETHLGDLSLNEILAEVLHDTAADSESRNIEASLNAEGPIKMRGDHKLLYSAFSNLVRNAIKFSKPGGTVTIGARASNGRVVIDIEDSCGGLADGAVEKIFDPFVQAGNDRSGFGLGLSIAKQAAEAHGGAVRVHNLPGKGCVFVLDLPQMPVAPQQTQHN